MRVLDSDPGALNSKAVSRASDRRFGQLGAASAILLVLTFTTGFENDPQPSENAQPAERFARSTYPTGPWVRESEFPKPSPKSPLMVIREVTQYAPGTEPTSEQAKAAQELIESCYASAIRNGWNDYDTGLRTVSSHRRAIRDIFETENSCWTAISSIQTGPKC